MPQVDFTLEDMRQVVREEVRPLIEESELRIIRAVQGSFDEYEKKYDAKFRHIDAKFEKIDLRFDSMDKRFDTMDARLDNLTAEVKSTRRLVGVHSEEIMELKARTS